MIEGIFTPYETPLLRTEKLNALHVRLAKVEGTCAALPKAPITEGQSYGDPGDLVVYIENGLA